MRIETIPAPNRTRIAMQATSVMEALRDFPIPLAAAFSFVALIGYLIGHFRRERSQKDVSGSRRELKRAWSTLRQMESLNTELRRQLDGHQSTLVGFKDRISNLSSLSETAAWQELSAAAETLLKPTQRLTSHLANAYDELRQQTNFLMTFTEVRTDPLTGVSNRRALDETLTTLVAMHTRYKTTFSIAIFDIDHFKRINDEQGHLEGDRILRDAARLFDDCVRDTDIVTSYGGEVFVVVMPETDLDGACIFAERMRQSFEENMPCTVSCGAASAICNETAQALLGRADTALYDAKNHGRNKVYLHDGESTTVVTEPPAGQRDEDTSERRKPQRAEACSVGSTSS